MQNLVQHCGRGVLAHPPYYPSVVPCDCWLLASVKEGLRGTQFESQDDVNTAVTASSHLLSEDEHTAASDRLPRRSEKSADSAGDCIH